MVDSAQRLEHVARLYELLEQIEVKRGGKRGLSYLSATDMPRRGVYFFFEEGESRTTSGSGLRVVRVGTHAVSEGSKSTLYGRLAQHRGIAGRDSGNHRGSIFRLLVGEAMMRSSEIECPGWGSSSRAQKNVDAEATLEAAVSQYLRRMSVTWLAIDDEPSKHSLRGYIERNSISLLSNYAVEPNPIDPPSDSWLGNLSPRQKVSRSGLWNQNHVEEVADYAFLDKLEVLIDSLA